MAVYNAHVSDLSAKADCFRRFYARVRHSTRFFNHPRSGSFHFLAVIGLCLIAAVSLGSANRAEAVESAAWLDFKRTYIFPEGRVADPENGWISHSEGQGWAMLLAAANRDRDAFDRMWFWTRKNLQRSDVPLFSWRYDPFSTPHVTDLNNATDGDILIAWALMRAGKVWQDAGYRAASREIREAIITRLRRNVAGYEILLPGLDGFALGDGFVVNLSYAVIPAFEDFHKENPYAGWDKLIDDHRSLLRTILSDPQALPPDWLFISNQGSLFPATGWPPRFGFDAVRIPLYLTWSEGPNTVSQMIAYRWGTASQKLQDAPDLPAWVDVMSGRVAHYPASQGVTAIWNLARGALDRPIQAPSAGSDTYYSSVLALLSNLAWKEWPNYAPAQRRPSPTDTGRNAPGSHLGASHGLLDANAAKKTEGADAANLEKPSAPTLIYRDGSNANSSSSASEKAPKIFASYQRSDLVSSPPLSGIAATPHSMN